MIHLIFEGAELSGKSWLMSQVYLYLEKKYGKSSNQLDGCHWFNADIGIFGTKDGQDLLSDYLAIFKRLKKRNLIIEKFHFSEKVYSKLYRKKNIDIDLIEKELKRLNFKIIIPVFPEKIELIKDRLKDRLNLYPHYKKIAKKESWYIDQQRKYLELANNTSLPVLILPIEKYPDYKAVKKIINFINK